MAWETIFTDGADHYVTADIGKKWSSVSGAYTVDTTVFRNAGGSLKVTASSSTGNSVDFPPTKNVLVGFAIRLASAPGAATWSSLFAGLAYFSAGSYTSNNQVGLSITSDGLTHVARGGVSNDGISGTLLASSTDPLGTTTWAHVQFRVFIHDTAGEIELRINGVPQFSLTGLDTRNSSTLDHVSRFTLRVGGSTGSGGNLDDVYVRTSDLATAEPDGFLGDLYFRPYAATADGTYVEMTPSTGTSHFALVDEATPNNTDYVSGSTALQKDSFTFAASAEAASIKTVQLCAYAYKLDSGFRGVDLFAKSGATEDFAASQTLSISEKYKRKNWDVNPATGVEWTQAQRNAAEFGVRVSADI